MKSPRLSTSAMTLAAVSFALVSTAFSAAATQESAVDRLLREAQYQAGNCETPFNRNMSEGSRCLLGVGLEAAVDEGIRLTDEYGKRTFGPNFQVVGNLTYARYPQQTGLRGDVDVVLPLSGSEPTTGEKVSTSAFFLQQGITRWSDGFGTLRDDLRHGLVYRFRVSDRPDADVVGFSIHYLVNAAHQHEVLASVIDYAGRWGIGSFRYFNPTTDWRPGHTGSEEKALEGMEFAAGLDITSTIGVSATGYRWESEDGSEHWKEGVRLDMSWQPHPWLRFVAGYDRLGEGDRPLSVAARLRVPFNGSSSPPRWEGLGARARGLAPDTSSLWTPTLGVGQIRVATRATPPGLVADAEVRFLQNTVESGNSVRLEVVLPTAASEDIRITVRLIPGTGQNPAVAGEDFVDEAVEATIVQGSSSVEVSIQLLQNDGMQGNRSLGATVSLTS